MADTLFLGQVNINIKEIGRVRVLGGWGEKTKVVDFVLTVVYSINKPREMSQSPQQ